MTQADINLIARLSRLLGRKSGSPLGATVTETAAAIRQSTSHISRVLSGERNLSAEVRKRARAALERLTNA